MLYVFRIYYMEYRLYYMDFVGFIVYIKTDNIYKDITEDVDTRFDTSNYELDKPLPNEKYKKVIGLIKHELDRKIMTRFVGLRANSYKELIGDGTKDKKAQKLKKGVYIKRKFKFENYKNCLEAIQLENKINYQ